MKGSPLVIWELLESISKAVKSPDRIKMVSNQLAPQEILHIIKKHCHAMVCMRLHSAIFAANAGIPFICVSFNTMHTAFVEMVDMTDFEILFEAGPKGYHPLGP